MSETASVVAGVASPATSSDRAHPAWAAVVSLSLGVFGLVTAEFLPASLLTRMARDLGVTDGAAGQAVTATAVVGGIAGTDAAIVTRSIDRRLVLWALTLLLIVSNLLAASAAGLATLLVARVLLGIGLGGFWSMAAALAMRLVPMRLVPRAMSIVLTGVSVATVCAAPVGAYVGDLWGWRAAFVIAAAVGGLALIVQMITMPKLPPVGGAELPHPRGAAQAAARCALVLLAVVIAISGHFAGFTYIRPFLEQVPALDVDAISLVLLAYGIGGFFGNFAGAFVAERSVKATVGLGVALHRHRSPLRCSSWLVGAWLPARPSRCGALPSARLPVGLQTWMVRAAPDQAESAGGLLVPRSRSPSPAARSLAACWSTASAPSAPSPIRGWRHCSALELCSPSAPATTAKPIGSSLFRRLRSPRRVDGGGHVPLYTAGEFGRRDAREAVEQVKALDRRQHGDVRVGRIEIAHADWIKRQRPLNERRRIGNEAGVGQFPDARFRIEGVRRSTGQAGGGASRLSGKEKRRRLMKRIGPALVAKDVPPEGDGATRAKKAVDAFQGRHGVEPMECRGTGDEVEGGFGEVRALERQGEDLEFADRRPAAPRKSDRRRSGSMATSRRGRWASRPAVAKPVPAPISRTSIPGRRPARSRKAAQVSAG